MSRPSLTARLTQVAHPSTETQPSPASAPIEAAKSKAPATSVHARIGKTMIAGYFSADLAKAIRILAAERGVTIQALIGEGLDAVLREAGKHPMGER